MPTAFTIGRAATTTPDGVLWGEAVTETLAFRPYSMARTAPVATPAAAASDPMPVTMANQWWSPMPLTTACQKAKNTCMSGQGTANANAEEGNCVLAQKPASRGGSETA